MNVKNIRISFSKSERLWISSISFVGKPERPKLLKRLSWLEVVNATARVVGQKPILSESTNRSLSYRRLII